MFYVNWTSFMFVHSSWRGAWWPWPSGPACAAPAWRPAPPPPCSAAPAHPTLPPTPAGGALRSPRRLKRLRATGALGLDPKTVSSWRSLLIKVGWHDREPAQRNADSDITLYFTFCLEITLHFIWSKAAYNKCSTLKIQTQNSKNSAR